MLARQEPNDKLKVAITGNIFISQMVMHCSYITMCANKLYECMTVCLCGDKEWAERSHLRFCVLAGQWREKQAGEMEQMFILVRCEYGWRGWRFVLLCARGGVGKSPELLGPILCPKFHDMTKVWITVVDQQVNLQLTFFWLPIWREETILKSIFYIRSESLPWTPF